MSNGRHRLRFGVAEYRRYRAGIEEPLIERIEFSVSDSFWDWVVTRCPEGSVTLLLAHNWNLDGGILEPDKFLAEYGYTCQQFINDGRPPVIITFRCEGRGTIKLIDTLNYFTSSVASIGKSLGKEKLEMPSDSADREAWSEYAWRDVEIIRDAYLVLRNFIATNDLGKMPPTLASLAFASFKYRFMKHDIYVHDRNRALSLERESYYGGRVECFYIGKTEGEDLYKFDVNSMYPTVMRSEQYSARIVAFQRNAEGFNEAIQSNGVSADITLQTDKPIYPLSLIHISEPTRPY